MRRGEILNLKWSDVGADSLVVRGDSSKTEQSRTIPLNEEARAVLTKWESDSEWVYPGKDESPISTIKRSWAGIRKEARLPKVRFHDLRHTFATRLLQKGADIRTVSASAIETSWLLLDTCMPPMRANERLLNCYE